MFAEKVLQLCYKMLTLLSFSQFCVEIVKVTFFFIGLIKVIDFCLYELFGEITAEFEHHKPRISKSEPGQFGKPSSVFPSSQLR
jgi:hypothetical protein